MKIPLLRPKSAGVPVSPAVHRLLSEANAARDKKEWADAAEGYQEALALDPNLRHIWIQLGHAEKEAGDFEAADAAYGRAEALSDADGEPALFMGHVAKLRGDGAAACRHYLRATQQAPNNADAASELYALVERRSGLSRSALAAALGITAEKTLAPTPAENSLALAARTLTDLIRKSDTVDNSARVQRLASAREMLASIEAELADDGDNEEAAAPALVFDASDLISYFRNARLPTGIQRVQIETISSALKSTGKRIVKICCFTEHRDEWLEIPPATFLHLAALSVSDGDRSAPEWTGALNRLRLELAFADRLIFPDGAFLINLGTSWWLQNYFLFVRQAKVEHGIRYVPFVHDFIPIMTPEHCVTELTRDFITWAVGVFQHADFFLVNSEATKRDLVKVAGILGHDVDPDAVSVITLDADFRSNTNAPLPETALGRFRVKRSAYILFVSTIESRKNHVVAFDAWLKLVNKHGAKRVPKLVCVGNKGWLNDAVYRRLDQNALLRDRVVMLSHLSDEELALLYRNCLFTLYPSQYEGWGLPVTESLCYGKVPLLADTSSLPEAGGPFADYFPSGSVDDLADALEKLMFDGDYRQARERNITDEFRPRTWGDIASQIEREVIAFSGKADGPSAMPPSVAQVGAFYPLVRNRETRIWRGMASAEMFRSGSGWWWPDDWGCWTKKDGGRLEIGLPGDLGALRAYLKLVGPPRDGCDYTVSIEGEDIELAGRLEPGEHRWVAIDIAEPGDRLQIELVSSSSVDLAELTGGLDARVVSLGIGGFFISPASDLLTRTRIIEAIVLNGTEELAFNREPPSRP